MAIAIPVQDSAPRSAEGGFDIPKTNIAPATTEFFDMTIKMNAAGTKETRGWVTATVTIGVPANATLNTAKRLIAILKIGVVDASAHASAQSKRYISFSVHSWTVPYMRSFPFREAGRLSDTDWGWAGGQIRLQSCRIYDGGRKIRLGVRNTHASGTSSFGAYVDWEAHR